MDDISRNLRKKSIDEFLQIHSNILINSFNHVIYSLAYNIQHTVYRVFLSQGMEEDSADCILSLYQDCHAASTGKQLLLSLLEYQTQHLCGRRQMNQYSISLSQHFLKIFSALFSMVTEILSIKKVQFDQIGALSVLES